MLTNVPHDHLTRFVADARRRVAAGAYACTGEPLAPNGSLAVKGVIAEMKARSPSEGRLLHGDRQALLRSYVQGGAAAISCLTDADHFDGDPAHLRLAHATGLPVLMKDFIIDEAQLDAARHHGASGVLLIEAAIADPRRREELVQAAHDRGLEVLLEIHATDDLPAAAASRADLLGVNARDLRTLAVDPQVGLATVARLARDGHHVVALSGVADRHAAHQAFEAGAAAVLVGTHLVRHPLPALALRGLLRPLVKVCGIRDPAALQAALGADLVGFVVHSPRSPRDLPAAAAARLAAAARSVGMAPVLVTDHPDPEVVAKAAASVRPAVVQVHGFMPAAAWIDAQRQQGRMVLAAVHAGTTDLPPCDVLIDNAEGGRGQTVDWDAARRTVESAGDRLSFIAGGLGPDNAATALAATGASGADASSGLESSPGIKDPRRIRAFIQAVVEAP